MKKALHKDFWMEIRRNKARFISIFCIVALGVAFFSGIQAASPDMRFSGDAYYDESRLMDIKVVGTMGLTEDDVRALEAVDGVQEAEGAYGTDAVCLQGDSQEVLHIEAMNQNVNKITVSEGRLPEKSGECFLDTAYAQNYGYELGDELILRQEEDSELLKKEKFTIVGIGSSPLYISFNRGNTTLGSGEVEGFAYVLPDDFDQEVCTQIYLRVSQAEDLVSYTDAYDNLIDKVSRRVEGIQEERCQIRYDNVVADAEKELADARKDLEDGKKEADQELEDAAKELEDGEKEIADGRQELLDGEKELEDAKAELADGRQQVEDAKMQLADGKNQLEDARAELADGRQQLESARAQLVDGRSQLDAAKQQLSDGWAQLAPAKEQLEAGWAEYEAGAQKLQESRQQLADGKRQLEEGRQKIAAGRDEIKGKQAELDAALVQIAEGRNQLAASEEQLNVQKKQCEDGLAQIAEVEAQIPAVQAGAEAARVQAENAQNAWNAAQAEVNDRQAAADIAQNEVNSAQAELDAAQAALAAAQAALEAGTGDTFTVDEAARAAEAAGQNRQAAGQRLNEALAARDEAAQRLSEAGQVLGTAQANLDAASRSLSELTQAAAQRQALEAGLAQVNEGYAQIEAERKKLDAAQSEANAGQKEITDGLQQLNAEEQKLNASEQQMQASEKQLAAGQAELDASLRTLEESQSQVNANEQKLAAAQAEIDANERQLAAAQAEIDANEQQLVSGEQEIAASEQTLADGEREIAENEQKLADGEQEIETNERKLADARQEIAAAEKELEKGRREYEDAKKEAEQKIADGEQKIADAEQEIRDLKLPEWYVTDRHDLPEYSDYGDNADRIRNIGEVFPAIFFLVAALISLTTMTRMVEEQRTQIGTLKALGYGKFAIASKYLRYAFLATVGGSIAGILIGEKILPYIIITAYGIMYHNMSASIQVPYELKFALMASAAAIACTIGATIFSCCRELAETPASLMRPPAPKEGKRVLIEHVTILWKHLNFTWKSTLRNMFRYKKRFFMTIFGISGSMALMLVGFGIKDSVSDIAARQYSVLQHYDGTIIDDEDASEGEYARLLEFLEENEKISHFTQIHFANMTIPKGSSNLNAYIYVPEDLENFPKDVTLQDRITGEAYQLTDEGAVICEKTASLLGLKVGDEIVLERDNQQYSAGIAAITENYMGHYVYMTPAVYEKTFHEEPDYADIVFTMKEEYKADAETVGLEILNYPAALSISYTGSIAATVERMLSTLGMVIIVLIVSAGMLAFVVLYNLNNINITERKRELATLKVLGFFDTEVSGYVLRENILLTLLSMAVGAGLGVLLHRFVIVTVEVDAVMFGRNIRPVSFLYCALLTAAFAAAVNGAMHFKLKKIDMVESLKSVE